MLDISVERAEAAEPVAVLRLNGELDQSNYLELIDRARALREEGVRGIVLDLGGLTYMGSSGIFALRSIAIVLSGDEPPDPEDGWGAIHSSDSRPAEELNRVKLLNAQPSVDRVLDRTGMKRYFETFTDRAAAVASF